MSEHLHRRVVKRAKRVLRSVATGRVIGHGRRRSAAHGRKVHPDAHALVRAKVMDAGFYGAQVGVKFADRTAAAEHYLVHGARRELMFHPLINPRFAPDHVRGLWREGNTAAVVEYLFSARGVVRPWSTLFDPRLLVDTADEEVDPVAAVVEFFNGLNSGTVLPPRPQLLGARLTWGEARRAMIASARTTRQQRRLTRTRTTKHWDEDAERAWLDVTISLADAPSDDDVIVSVIMPVWNRADRVLEAIRSVQQQTLGAWELLLVDDGSTDGSLAVLEAAAAADPRIVVVAEEHRGVAAARNSGLERARGRYVAFLDSDNTWRPHFLSTMVAAMTASDLRSAYAAVRLVDGDGGALYRAFKGDLRHLLVVNHIDLNTFVVDTSVARAAGGFDTALRRWVDHDFAIKVARIESPVLLPFVGCDYDDAAGSTNRITVSEPDNWQFVALGNAHVDWESVRQAVPERMAGRVSVVIPTYQDCAMTTAAVAAVVEHSAGHDVEVIVVDNDSHPHISLEVAALALAFESVSVVRLPRNLNFATGSNVGFARSTGEYVIFLNNDTEVREGWLEPQLARIADPEVRGVQPLLLYPDDTIQTAGTVFPVAGSMPVHLLAGYPREDAAALGRFPFSAVTAAAVLMRASEVAALRGFDPIFVNGSEDIDLCLRATEAFGGHFVVEPSSVVVHKESKTPGRGTAIGSNRQIFLDRWRGRLPGPERMHFEALGLEVAAMGASGEAFLSPAPVLTRRPRRVALRNGSVVESLRWNIKNAAVPGPRGDEWGDTHFVTSLSDALRRSGQEVVTSRHGVHVTPCHAIDDVNLVIRGLDRVPAQPGKTNVLWVISHPDDVSVDEVLEYDLVFAASISWAQQMSRRSGKDVQVLLQATDPTRFHPPIPEAERNQAVVFVGQARRGEPRTIVMDAIEAGLTPDVWGPRWAAHIAPALIRGHYIANERLGSLYRNSALVLNDHWPDMRDEGFISNRLFDAVACGARVVSDPVTGIEELFEGAVRVYSSADDLRVYADVTRLDEYFPGQAERAAIAARVGAEHSFDRRAAQLVEAVATHRGAPTVARLPLLRHVTPSTVAVHVREPERRCIYSALFGGYERPSPQPAFGSDDTARILFTDDPALRSDDWEVRVVPRALPADPGRSSRWPKILPHLALPDFDVSLYVDTSVQLRAAPSKVIDALLPEDAVLALLAHSYRGVVADEFGAVVGRRFDADERIREQLEHYAAVSPEALQAQTLWGGMLLRRHHDPIVVEAMEIWWQQVLRYSRRDQLSLPYALRAAGLVPTVHALDNKDTELHKWPIEIDRDRSRAFSA